MNGNKEWFSEWFDSPYYHILYQHRDNVEAEFFLTNLSRYLDIPTDRKIVDLACGKGRHAIFLNSLGYQVTGVDLSESSIADANKTCNDTLNFEVGDLRLLRRNEEFDIAMNLFTSFGYFNSREEDEAVMRNIHQILKPSGLLIIDFMNIEKVKRDLVEFESKTLEGITFQISRYTTNEFIVKKISFTAGTKHFEFNEQVQALLPEDFDQLLEKSGFRIIRTFGNYALQEFNRGISDRFIIIAQKV